MKTANLLTHMLEYQRPDGTWEHGFMGFTLAEAQDIRKIAMRRTGRAVRVVKLP